MRASPVLAAALLGGCSVAVPYARPAAALPAGWIAGDARLAQAEAALPSLAWRDVFADTRLQALIARALAANQRVALTLANVEAARGLYRVSRAQRLPTIDGTAATTLRRSNGGTALGANANVGGSFELDLFGRVASLNTAALDEFYATEAAVRAARVTLVADVAQASLTYAGDRDLLTIAQDTARVAGQSVTLTRARLRGGVAPRTDLRQAETVLATAQSDIANLTTIVEQDRNAVELLVGGRVVPAELPASLGQVAPLILPVRGALPSAVLLRRPDVLQAEYRLQAATARIGAARAAFFPAIGLTGLAGFASTALTRLFTGGAFGFSAGPSLSVPIFDGGANRGNLGYARAQRDAAVATYQLTIQQAFRDVADALARTATIDAQLAAQARLEAAARDTAFLVDARYRGGIDTFLTSLDAQRTLYAARRSRTTTLLTAAIARAELYRAIGGDNFSAAPAARR